MTVATRTTGEPGTLPSTHVHNVVHRRATHTTTIHAKHTYAQPLLTSI
jgi:hypothetical protein